MGDFVARVSLSRAVCEEDVVISWGNLQFSMEPPFGSICVSKDVPNRARKEIISAVRSLEANRRSLHWGDLGQQAQKFLNLINCDLIAGVRDVLFQIRVTADLVYTGVRGECIDQEHTVWHLNHDEQSACQQKLCNLPNLCSLADVVRHNEITLPLPPRDKSCRSGALTAAKLQLVEDSLRRGVRTPPAFLDLFVIAQDNYQKSAYSAAVVCLAVASETAIKALLGIDGQVTEYILANISSPPIPQMIACARNELGLDLTVADQETLGRLARKRNEIVHKSHTPIISDNELVQWFDIVERLIKNVWHLLEESRLEKDNSELVEHSTGDLLQ